MVQPVKIVDSLIPGFRENLEGDSLSIFTVVELGVELELVRLAVNNLMRLDWTALTGLNSR